MNSTPIGRVRITKPVAMIMKITYSSELLNSIMLLIRYAASATPIVATTVVFLVNAIMTLPSGAIAPRNAWGSIDLGQRRHEAAVRWPGPPRPDPAARC